MKKEGDWGGDGWKREGEEIICGVGGWRSRWLVRH